MNRRILSRQWRRLDLSGADVQLRPVSRGEVPTATPAVDEMLKLGSLLLQPKTPEQRLQRMLTTPGHTRPYGMSVDQVLWRLVAEPSGSVRDRLVVESPFVRGPF